MSMIRALTVITVVVATPVAGMAQPTYGYGYQQSQPSYQPSYQPPATSYLPQSSYPAGNSFNPSVPPGNTPVGCFPTGPC